MFDRMIVELEIKYNKKYIIQEKKKKKEQQLVVGGISCLSTGPILGVSFPSVSGTGSFPKCLSQSLDLPT